MLLAVYLSSYFLIVSGSRGGRRGGSHQYPSTHGLSGTGYTHQQSTGGSGHTYPKGTGLSGNSAGNYHHKTEVHNHYHYNPPQQINYGSTYHPVYHGPPPVYVYEYRNSGSRFDSLLTGLALYNLGRMSAHSHDHSHYNEYRGTPGEICKMGISKPTGDYEETRIDCRLMSSFIWDVQPEKHETVSKIITTVNTSETISGNETVTVQNTTVVNALEVKGPSLKVTEGMDCFMIRDSRYSSYVKKRVDCALLQEYAMRSLRAYSDRVSPVLYISLCSLYFTIL
ncbi:uncharacterized protein LOC126966001 [Leptidea sinapis]|uniref:uncharacterized protein LOC126966001 n=1 Tax=Leptidea sinapis TaxID=189913 RepID=UPI0021C3BC5C|nr:uncharacterized protein LOC126966001 [Leptidea sinapis]